MKGREKRMKNQKGITLIALIITIIVMLILVGVTINVALNGEIFDTANKAVKDTERDIIHEQIIEAMKVNNEKKKINVDVTYNSAKEILEAQGKTVEVVETNDIDGNTTIVNFKVKGKKGTYEYSITETEIKKGYSEIEDEIDILAELKKYEGTSVMDFLEGGYDVANGCYRTNYPGLEKTATYISYGCGIVRAFNEDNTHTDYIFTVESDGATLDKVRLQPEVETIQISNEITAISNLEDFEFYEVGEYWKVTGLDVGGSMSEDANLYKYYEMDPGIGVNAIILENVEYFNEKASIKIADIINVEIIYVPTDFKGVILGENLKYELDGTTSNESLNKIKINEKEYYVMPYRD